MLMEIATIRFNPWKGGQDLCGFVGRAKLVANELWECEGVGTPCFLRTLWERQSSVMVIKQVLIVLMFRPSPVYFRPVDTETDSNYFLRLKIKLLPGEFGVGK